MALRQAVLGMERASFFYDSARVFGGVSFLLDGARTALVGENGAGKSTLLKCLTGELELNGGQVIRSRGLRIGTVPQDVPEGLAEQSVRGVLAASLTRAGLDGEEWRIDVLFDEIGAAPDLLDRPFGSLSGGWQRLMLIAAAARLEEPDILVLDEPTAAIDAAAEAEVFEHFRELTRNRIAIVISHRFSTVRMADQILVLEEGRIVERGSHDSLIGEDGRYAKLFTLQARGYR